MRGVHELFENSFVHATSDIPHKAVYLIAVTDYSSNSFHRDDSTSDLCQYT